MDPSLRASSTDYHTKYSRQALEFDITFNDTDSNLYAAKNVSNDHDFSKLFAPSVSPSSIPTLIPSTEPSSVPSASPSVSPTSSPTLSTVRSCVEIANEVPVNDEEEDTAEDVVVEIANNLTSQVVMFTYELVTPVGEDVNEALIDLERVLLDATASSVLSCDRRRRLQDEDEVGQIVRIESDPVDAPDEKNGACFLY